MILYIDGASRGNPGHAGIGVIIQDIEGRRVLERSRYIGETTNNVAEYFALITGLEEVCKLGARKIRVYSDSQLLVRQVKGEYKVKKPHLSKLHKKVLDLLKDFDSYDIIFIPRELNKEADSLANRAIDESAR